MPEVLRAGLLEHGLHAVPGELVDVQEVVRDEIVGHIEVNTLVIVEIRDPDPEPEPSPVEPQLPGDVREDRMVKPRYAVVSQQVVRKVFRPLCFGPGRVAVEIRLVLVVNDVDVEVPVSVVVVKDGLLGVASVVQTVFPCHFNKGGNSIFVSPLVDEEEIVAIVLAVHSPHVEIDVIPSVGIDIHDVDPGDPAACCKAGLLRDVLKAEGSPVHVEFGGYLASRKDQVRKAILVEVADADPSAVEAIQAILGVHAVVLGDYIGKRDP